MGSFFQLLKELGPAKIAALVAVAVIFIVGFAVLTFKLAAVPMVPLYSNLDMKDSAKITAELDARNVSYELRSNGSQILVPSNMVLRLRMAIAQEGIPTNGSLVGYELFDNADKLGTSHFVQNINLLRALEGELGRTIGSFKHIDSARVHLVIPKRTLFSRNEAKPTASVVLEMRGSQSLAKGEINAISHLVATAVPNLDVNNITIVNTKGHSLKLGAADEDDPGMVASTGEQFRVSYEKRLKNTVETLFQQVLGPGKVRAQISAKINFDRTVVNSEIYDPDGQVVRSVQSTEERETKEDGQTKENVSVGNNLPNAKGDEAGAKNRSNKERINETTNYEISKTIRNHISETGVVNHLSVALLVDGSYETNEETNEVTYIPRTQEELDKYAALVRSAVGFNAERGDMLEVVNLQFVTDLSTMKKETLLEWFKRELRGLVQTLIIGIVVIMVILMVVRPIVRRAFELTKGELEEAELQEMIAAVPSATPVSSPLDKAPIEEEEEESMIDIERIEARVRSSSGQSINDIIEKYPEETLTIFRSWLNKD